MNKAMGKWMGVLLSVLILVSIIPINLVSAAQSDIRINENSRFAETKLVSTVYNLSNKEKGSILEGVILEIIGQSEDQVFFYLNDELLYLNIDTVEFLNSDYVPAYEDVENESLNKTDMMFETTEEVKIYADGKFEKTVATIYANQEFSGFMDENNIIHIRFSDKMGYIPGLDGVVEQSEEVNVNVVETEEVQEPVDENGTSQENIIQEDVHTEINMPESASYVGSVARFTTNNLPLEEEHIFTKPFFEVIENNVPIYDNSTGKLVQVGSLTKGQTYPIVSDYGDWHQVKYGNGYGYVWKDATKPSDGTFLKNLNNGEKNSSSQIIATSALAVYDNTSGQLVQYGTILKGQSYPIIANMGTWLKIDFAGRIGYVYEPATKRPFKNTDSFFEAIENNIAIYDNSTGKLVQVGSLVKGQEYPISAHYGDWHQIKFGRGYAYVWKDATKPANGSSIKNENKNELLSKWNFTSQESVAVYDNTSGSLVPFAVLNEGVTYPYISTYGTDWLKIDVSGRIGYVFKTAVQQNHSYQYTSYSITLQEMVDKQFSAGAQTDNKYDTYVREDALILNSAKTSGTANGSWNVRGGAGTNYWIVGTINNGEIVKILGQVIGADGYTWYKINYNQTWVNASSKDIEYYVNPLNFSRDTSAYYQFLDLSKVAGVTATEVNQKILYNKGIFINEAQSFITAASTYNVNEIYLISHALLETGNGKSTLATGVMVSTVNGKPVEPKTVYNVYGIGALDRCPLTCGAEYAYDQNWFTPEAAIIGGAKFIAERYINHATYKQNTLYKMRWNPTQPGSHQYATDIGWAYKQVSTISNLYNLIDKYTLQFDVPQFK